MEAMWMRFFPAMARVRRWLHDGVIGEPRLLTADFCVDLPYDPQSRLFDLALGGGALLDLGIYPLSLASMIFGRPASFRTYAQLGATGVDELDAIALITPTPSPSSAAACASTSRARHSSPAAAATSRFTTLSFTPSGSRCSGQAAAPKRSTCPTKATAMSMRSKRSTPACAPAKRKAPSCRWTKRWRCCA